MSIPLPNLAIPGAIDKFMTIKDLVLDYDFAKFPKNNTIKSKDICLVYCLWSNPEYFKFLYISLVSNLKYTDVANYDIFLFVEQSLFNTAQKFFGHAPITIIPVDYSFNKYSILTHSALEVYSKIVISDCDTFMNGRCFPLYALLSYNDHLIMMMQDPCPNTLNILQSRSCLSRSNKNYLSTVAGFIGWSEKALKTKANKERWFLSCFTCVDKRWLTDEWREHVNKFLSIKSWCDETVFLTYAWKHGINIGRVEDSEGIGFTLSKDLGFINPDADRLYITHPVHGYNCHDKQLKTYFRSLLDCSSVSLDNSSS